MSSLRARVGSLDPWPALVGVISLVVYVLHGYNGAFQRDVALYAYGGQRLLDGDAPYVGVLNRAGPLAHVIPAIGIGLGRLVGVGDVHAVRAFYTLIAAACVAMLYVLARTLFASRGAALVTAAAFLGFESFLNLATDGPREKTPMVLFLIIALLAFHHRRWLTFGVFTALATLTWQPVFLVLLVAGLVGVALAPEGRLRALLRVLVGGGATTLVVVMYYVAEGALHTFFEGFVLINAKYTKQSSGFSFDTTWPRLTVGYGASVWVVLVGLVAFPVVAVVAVLSARSALRSREATPCALAALVPAWLAGLLWTGYAFNGAPDLFELLPFAGLGIGGLALLVVRRVDGRVALGALGTLAVAGTAFAVVTSVTTRADGLLVQRASVAAVLHAGPAHPTMLSIQAPEVLVIAGLTNPSPIQMFGNGFSDYVNDTWPGGLSGYAAWIEQQDPTYVVVQTGLHPRWLMKVLDRSYHQVGTAPGFEWWAQQSLGPQVWDRIHAANRKAVGRG